MQTSGVCGNKDCDTGERCDGTNAATCWTTSRVTSVGRPWADR
jgi:hypothetical protein